MNDPEVMERMMLALERIAYWLEELTTNMGWKNE